MNGGVAHSFTYSTVGSDRFICLPFRVYSHGLCCSGEYKCWQGFEMPFPFSRYMFGVLRRIEAFYPLNGLTVVPLKRASEELSSKVSTNFFWHFGHNPMVRFTLGQDRVFRVQFFSRSPWVRPKDSCMLLSGLWQVKRSVATSQNWRGLDKQRRTGCE